MLLSCFLFSFLARLDEVQEELFLYYPGVGVGVGVGVGGGVGVSKMFKFFLCDGELSCPCDRSCFSLIVFCFYYFYENKHEFLNSEQKIRFLQC